MLTAIILATSLITMPLQTTNKDGCKVEEFSDYAKVTFKSGKVTYYHIQGGQWVTIDPVKEIVMVENLD